MARSRVPAWARWTVLAVVMTVALVIGSGVFTSTPQTPAQRAAALESQLKCPACQDLSVAQSSSASSAAVRQEVKAGIAAGETNDQIIAGLRARYGNAVLLMPPAGGLTTLLWIVPAALVIAIATAVGVVAVRRRRSLATPVPETQ